MIINVASKNDVKIHAVEDALKQYPYFEGAIVQSLHVSSGVSDQPISLDEIAQGASNRAMHSFVNADYSFGIEDGIVQMPSNGSMHYAIVSACAFYDGKRLYLGTSDPFFIPEKVAEKVLYHNMDLNRAVYTLGLTDDPSIGRSIGAVGLLSKGSLNRKEHIQQGITNALNQM